jgi:hypothetical protein
MKKTPKPALNADSSGRATLMPRAQGRAPKLPLHSDGKEAAATQRFFEEGMTGGNRWFPLE